jgi:hypothetical protein
MQKILIDFHGLLIMVVQADGRTLIDMLISGEFERKDVQKSITERQEQAKKWLSENLLTYDEWVAKHKTNS